MRVFGVFLSLNGLLFILCEREKFYYFLFVRAAAFFVFFAAAARTWIVSAWLLFLVDNLGALEVLDDLHDLIL